LAASRQTGAIVKLEHTKLHDPLCFDLATTNFRDDIPRLQLHVSHCSCRLYSTPFTCVSQPCHSTKSSDPPRRRDQRRSLRTSGGSYALLCWSLITGRQPLLQTTLDDSFIYHCCQGILSRFEKHTYACHITLCHGRPNARAQVCHGLVSAFHFYSVLC
jgi:hypothetical protein